MSVLQGALFCTGPAAVDGGFSALSRRPLDAGSWVDHQPRWLAGADEVYAALAAEAPWTRRQRVMYDRVVDEPRLTCWFERGDRLPHPLLEGLFSVLGDRWGRGFDSVGLNWYRSGADSVAWHADRVGRHVLEPVVAIVSLGQPRPFLLRPRGGGRSVGWRLGEGDLLVMGGRCQHDWEHCVPKVAAAGPRISVTFRHQASRS
ncbi:MAG: alpha-ketoglutarate-dependent dioxygenase AlkB family protein [Acidimicrobiales bacterium]